MEFGYFTLSDNHYPDNPRSANQFVLEIREQAILADRIGMHSCWIGEHHFDSLGVNSRPDLLLANIASQTKHVRLAPAVNVLPLHHPVHVAEMWATLDLLSGGRVDFATGRGYDRKEYQPFGADFMLRYREFDCSEMSLSSYVASLRAEEPPFIAIPVFPSRFFRHSCIFVSAKSGIRAPGDLKGRRIGVPEYQMTAPVWIRGILSDDYGVKVTDVEHYSGGEEEPGRDEKIRLSLPASIRVKPIGPAQTLSRMTSLVLFRRDQSRAAV